MIAQADFQLADADFQLVRDAVYQHCGISLNDEKKALVRARLAKQIRTGGFVSTKDYLRYALADRNGEGFINLIDAMSTNLTSFFREPEHFTFLASQALPALLEHKRQTGDGRILAWSAACSSGEEPYSLAITILEAIRQQPRSPLVWELRLLASDISTKMLAAGRMGRYNPNSMNSVPPAYRRKYFTSVEKSPSQEAHYTVSAQLRNSVQFRHLNLMDAWQFKGPFDLIFCRNVMIYFDQSTQQRLVDRFWNCLRPGGLFFTGHSESLTGINHQFIHRQPSIYEKAM